LTTFAALSLSADLIHESMMDAGVASVVNSSTRLLLYNARLAAIR